MPANFAKATRGHVGSSCEPYILEKCSKAFSAWFCENAEIQAMVFRWKKPIAVFQGYVASNKKITYSKPSRQFLNQCIAGENLGPRFYHLKIF